MFFFKNFRCLFPYVKLSHADSVEDCDDQNENIITFDNQRTYPRTNEHIPLLVTPIDCEYYLEEILGCREVFELGKGSFAIGYNVVLPECSMNNRAESKSVVVKTYRFGRKGHPQDHDQGFEPVFRNEIDCYRSLKHDHIVKFYSYFKFFWNEDYKEYYLETKNIQLNHPRSHYLMGGIVLEKMRFTLTGYLNDRLLDETLIGQVFYQIGSALVYLHRRHFIVHQDLKGSNIGISHFSVDGTPFLKLLDFGSSRRVDDRKQFYSAEKHSTRAFIRSTPPDIKVIDATMKALNENHFLDESRRFVEMIIRYSTDRRTIIPIESLRAAFEKVPMSDHKLKQILLRMLTNFNVQTVSLSQVWNYLGLKL